MSQCEPNFKLPRVRKRSKAQTDAAELKAVRQALLERSLGRCEAGFVLGCTGVGKEAHHIRRRAQGGKNDLTNLLWLCEPCHNAIHLYPVLARESGYLAPKGDA